MMFRSELLGEEMADDQKSHPDVEQILLSIRRDHRHSSEVLLNLLYDELRRLAARRTRGDRAATDLDPTSLVHEVYLRLIGDRNVTWQSRGHFFGAAAEAMRRILVDRARAQSTQKRGGHLNRSEMDSTLISLKEGNRADVLEVHEVLTELERHDPDMATIVKLRFFAGFTIEQIALATDVSSRTIQRRWSAARAWLLSELSARRALVDGD